MALTESAGLGRSGEELDGTGEFLHSLRIMARALHVKNAELEPALQAIVTTAVSMVGPAHFAGLITLSRGLLVPRATVGRPPQLLDELQRELNDGPCIDAARDQVLIRIDDMRSETRWPYFAAQAVAMDVHSMLCVPLDAHDQRLGTLSLYSRSATAFGPGDEDIAALFAVMAAIALAEAERTDQLRSALANRDVIGQAKGILMERHKITAEAAFGLLAQSSQDRNVKLAEVARRLVETGELPGRR